MKLSEFLPSIAHNPKLYLKIYDSDDSQIIAFEALGYQSLSSELSDRDVDKVTIAEEQDVLKIILKALPEPTPDPEPEPTPDDPNNVPLDPDQLNGSNLEP